MGLFGFKKKSVKVKCAVCSKEVNKEEATEKIIKYMYFCPECNTFLEDAGLQPLLDEERIKKAKAEIDERIEKYKDTFNPTIQCGKMFIDPEKGLFSTGTTYVPGVSPYFSFSDFKLLFEFKKIEEGAKDTRVVNDEYSKVGAFFFEGVDVRDWREQLYHISVPLCDEFEAKPNGNMHGYYYDIVPEYMDNLVEFIHQYLRHVSDEVYYDYRKEKVICKMSDSFSELLLVYGKPILITQIDYARFYIYVNSKFDRTSKDPKEIIACERLDTALAYCLAFCRKRGQKWLDIKNSGQSDSQIYWEMEKEWQPFLEAIKNMWADLEGKDYNALLPDALKELNKMV